MTAVQHWTDISITVVFALAAFAEAVEMEPARMSRAARKQRRNLA